jgi:hypothetical protein
MLEMAENQRKSKKCYLFLKMIFESGLISISKYNKK